MSNTNPSEVKNWRAYFAVFILFFVSYGYFFQGGGWNQNIRVCLTRAIIHHRTFIVDQYKEDSVEMEFVNAGDWSFYGGHYYSNKSPGLSFLAVPPFALVEYFLQQIIPHDPERQVLLSTYVSHLFTTVLMSSLLCLLIFHTFYYFFRMGLSNSLLATLFFGFGTLAFPYSTALYCHLPAAFCSFLAFLLAMHIKHDSTGRKRWYAFLAGCSAGLGVLMEPSSIYILIAVIIYLLTFQEGRQHLFLFVAGCVPAGAVQGLYNYVCFGHPLALSYNYANEMVMIKVNGKLFGIPNILRLNRLLFSPYRGLLFLSPIFVMALPGAFLFFREKKWRYEAVTSACVSVWFIMFIASFYGIVAATPPRYLLAAFPFMFLLAGFSLVRLPGLFKLFGAVSLLINLSITLVGIEIPSRLPVPLIVVALKNMIAGKVSINPVPISHFHNYPDIYDLANIDLWTPNFNSFNLGEIFFPHSVTSILPLIGFWVIWGWWWSKKIRCDEQSGIAAPTAGEATL